jgi:hypothetical protein
MSDESIDDYAVGAAARGQATELKAGRPVTYVVNDERLFINAEGRIVRTESARPAEGP